MIDRRIYRATVSSVALLSIAGFALGGCNRNGQSSATSTAPPALAALPLSTDAAPAAVPAPVASALPPAPLAPVGRLADQSERYAFADRADAMNSGFGDAQPDYTFDYGGGERPWVWRGDDQSARIAEPLPGGRDRYYYYEPGARTPYLVRDRDYSYGYANGALVVIYDQHGRVLPPDYLSRQADLAGRLLSRAQAVREASERQQRQAVARSSWVARHDEMDAERNQWDAQQNSEQDWRAYHVQHEQEYQAHWDTERYRREAEAARFAQSSNDPQQAEHDWQAARQAQARAAAAGQILPAQNSSDGRLSGVAPGQIPSPPQQPTYNGLASSQNPHQDGRGPGALSRQGQPENRPPPPNSAVSAAALATQQRAIAAQVQAQAAARQAEAQAAAARRSKMDAQHQAELDAMAKARAEAARQADAQAAASRQAEVAAHQRAQLLADAQARAQADAIRKADAQASAARRAQAEEQQRLQLETQTRAQAQAARQAEAQAAATRQAQIVAQHRLQIQSEAAAQAQAAARHAPSEAQGPAQAGLGIQREQALQAQQAEQARRKAQREARRAAVAAGDHSDPNAAGDPASASSDKAARRHHNGPASDQPDPGHP